MTLNQVNKNILNKIKNQLIPFFIVINKILFNAYTNHVDGPVVENLERVLKEWGLNPIVPKFIGRFSKFCELDCSSVQKLTNFNRIWLTFSGSYHMLGFVMNQTIFKKGFWFNQSDQLFKSRFWNNDWKGKEFFFESTNQD